MAVIILLTYCILFRFTHRVYHSAKVNIYGVPFIREMPKIRGVSGTDLVVKCPVAGYPIDKIHWERGKFVYLLTNISLCIYKLCVVEGRVE